MYSCPACQVECNSEVTWQDHVRSVRHEKRVAKAVGEIPLKQHVHVSSKNSKHKGNERQAQPNAERRKPTPVGAGVSSAKSSAKARRPSSSSSSSPFRCVVCSVTCNGEIPWKQHLSSKTHKENQQQVSKDPTPQPSHSSDDDAKSHHTSSKSVASSASVRKDAGSASSHKCATCDEPATFSCRRCTKVWYCSPECQREDWQDEHEAKCLSKMDLQLRSIARRVHFDRKQVAFDRNPWLWHGHGKFQCRGARCGHGWSSFKAAMDVDWKELRVTKEYRQECTKCGERAHPFFAQFPSMMEKLFEFLMHPPEREQNGLDDQEQTEKPHLEKLCELCGFGKHPRKH